MAEPEHSISSIKILDALAYNIIIIIIPIEKNLETQRHHKPPKEVTKSWDTVTYPKPAP